MNIPLTPVENELIGLIAEECGEALQIVGKILRHGLESSNPLQSDSAPNRHLLAMELGHVYAAMDLLCAAGILSERAIDISRNRKHDTVLRWLHHYQHPRAKEPSL